MYQMETYICWYLRVAMVPKMLMPNITQAITTRIVERHGQFGVFQALIACRASSVTTAPRMMTFHSIGGGDAELLAPQLHAAEPRNDVVGQAHIGRQQPAEQHAVDVQRAQAAVGEVGDRAQQLRPDELGRDGQGDDADDEEVARPS